MHELWVLTLVLFSLKYFPRQEPKGGLVRLWSCYSDLIRFLLVTFQMEYILEESDPVEMHERLQSLPTNVTDAYCNIFERLSPNMRNFARRILGWVFHA